MSDPQSQPRQPACKCKAAPTRVQLQRAAKQPRQQQQQNGPSSASTKAAEPASAASIITLLQLALSARQPTLIIQACQAITEAACNCDGWTAIQQQQATIPALLQCISADQPGAVAEHALRCICDLLNAAADVGSGICTAILQQQDSLKALVDCCKRDSPAVVDNATALLALLAQHCSPTALLSVQQPGAVAALVSASTLTSRDSITAQAAAAVLAQLAHSTEGVAAILQHEGAVDALVSQLGCHPTPTVAYALAVLADSPIGAAVILGQAHGVRHLFRCAIYGSQIWCQWAAKALFHLADTVEGSSAVLQQPSAVQTLASCLAGNNAKYGPWPAALLSQLGKHVAGAKAIIEQKEAIHVIVSRFDDSDSDMASLAMCAAASLAITAAGAAAVLHEADAVPMLAANLGRTGIVADVAKKLLAFLDEHAHARVFAALLPAVGNLARENAELAHENAEKGSLQDITRSLQEAVIGVAVAKQR